MLWSLLVISLIGSAHSDNDNAEFSTLNMTTYQSSVYISVGKESFPPDNAIDGKTDVCAHTLNQTNPWWTIDLLGIYQISSVLIWNKEHHNADINGSQIRVGNSRDNNGTKNDVCGDIRNFRTNSWNKITCAKKLSGRFITVFSPRETYLVLCEVRIFGKRRESPFELVTANKTWEDALDYCREKCMDLASILTEEEQTWAELEARNADTPFVWLALHYSCVLNVWFWVDNHGLKFDRWAPEDKLDQCDVSAAMKTKEDHLWFSKPDAKRFNFICK